MKYLVLFSLLILSFSINSQDRNDDVLPNAIRVKFQNSIDLPQTQNNFTKSQGSLKIGNQSVDQLNSKYHATNMKRVFPYAGKFEAKHRSYGLHLWYDIFTEPGVTVEELKLQYGNLKAVSVAEPITIYSHEDFKGAELNTNDPLLNDQWHYNNEGQSGGTFGADISLLNAWDEETGDSRVVVSVHDSGIDTDHPDLVNHLWINIGEIPNDNIDNDNNGFIDDYHGYNFAAAVVGGDPSSVEDYGGHGTHTSGTIAAENNNGVGVSGVAGGNGAGDGVRIMMMRLGDDNGSSSIYNPAPSFIYAADMGAVISSNSWGGGSYDQSIIDAIEYFTSEAGSPNGALDGGLVIFSSGNSDRSSQDYKADLDHLIMVSASNHNDQKAWYSNYGTWVDITAPGGETSVQNQGVLSTLPGNSYGFYQGTSMACPHVSGVAALLASKAYGSGLTNTQLEEALLSTTDPIDQLNPNYSGLLGSGRLNAEKALEAVARGTGSSSGELIIDPVKIVTEIIEGESETFTLKVINTTDFDLSVVLESSDDWITLNAANLTLAPNAVAKFEAEISSTIAGVLESGRITFSYNSFNSNTVQTLPVSVYTLGEPMVETIDTLNFGTQYVEYSVKRQFEIVNSGTNYLTISDARNFSSDFAIDFSDTTLAPSSSQFVDVTFTPSVAELILDSILFTTNDPRNSNYKVVLNGNGNPLSPPEIQLNPEAISIELMSAQNGSAFFNISNTGDEILDFYISANPADIVPLEEYVENYARYENKDLPTQNNGNYNGVGNLVSHQRNPVSTAQGLTWDGQYLWLKGNGSSTIYRYDVELQEVVDSITSVINSPEISLDFYDGYLWEHDRNNQIVQYDLEGTIITQVELPNGYNFSNGIAVDHDGIWLHVGYDFYLINDNSPIEYQFTNYDTYNLDAFETIGNKIYTVSNGRITSLNKNSRYDDFTVSFIGGHSGMNVTDIAFDGENAWVNFTDYNVLVEFDPFTNFAYPEYPSSGSIEPDGVATVTINYDLYSQQEGFNLTDVLRLNSNDLVSPTVDLPISINITGSAQIDVSKTALTFDSYIGYEAIDTITITNEGVAPLVLSSIKSSLPDFTFSFTEIEIKRYESYDLPISVLMDNSDTLEAILQIVSNDLNPEKDTINVRLYAIGNLAPEISIDTDSLSITLFENQIDSLPVTITNSGEGILSYVIVNAPSITSESRVVETSPKYSDGQILATKEDKPTSLENIPYYSSESIESNNVSNAAFQIFTPLEDVLMSLDENIELITSTLESRYFFRDGEFGSSIGDGGGDMYDGGNYLSTNLGSNLPYTNSNILSDQSYFGSESYFTAKYEGLFILSANMNEVNNFNISGNLGADGRGSVDGSVLSFTHNNIEWLGFVKRVYNAGDPSVNHLVIVPNNGTANHTFSSYSDDDNHQIDDLSGVNRLHYLLFAGSNGLYYSDNAILELMESYITTTEVNSNGNTLEPNTSFTDHIVFNTLNLDSGNYSYNVLINSNDPRSSTTKIPTELTIKSRPILTMNDFEAVYDTVFVGAYSTLFIAVQNLGSDDLILSNFSLNGSADISLGEFLPDTIRSGSSDYFKLMLQASSLGDFNSTLSFDTNDPLNSNIELEVNGYGIASSILSLDANNITDTLDIGNSKEYVIIATNTGTDPLNYRIVIEEKSPINFIVEHIEQIQTEISFGNGSLIFPSYENVDHSITPAQEITKAEQIADFRVSSGVNNVLLLTNTYDYQVINNVFQKLDESGMFGIISYINTYYTSLTEEQLKLYDAILYWDNSNQQSVLLGNLLADYVDNGGGLVTAMYANTNSTLQGRWSEEFEKYSLFNTQDIRSVDGYDNAFIAANDQDNHPILNNVDTLKGGYYSRRTTATPEQISSDAEIVATWNNGTPAIIASTNDNVRRVDLGFYPPSNSYSSRSWDDSTDGGQIMANALVYVSNGYARSEVTWIESSTYREENQNAQESREIAFTVNPEGLDEGLYGARAYFYSNDSRDLSNYTDFEISIDGTSNLTIPESLKFDSVSLGFAKTLPLSITNSGNGLAQFTVSIDSLSPFSLDYTSTDTLSIGIFKKIDLNVYFNTNEIGQFSDTIHISNVSDEQAYSVVVSGTITEPGIIRIEPNLINLQVNYQSKSESSFTIFNDGEGALDILMPAFHSGFTQENAELNNTEFIHFPETPLKGIKDTREGHSVVTGVGSDAFGYSYVDTTEPESPAYSWNDISDSGTELVLNDDDSDEIDLNFEFPFYGLRKSSLFIGSNGLLSFFERGVSSPINMQFPESSLPNSLIAPLWKDLSPNNGGTIHYKLDADKCVVQYTDVPDFDATGTFTFQVILYRSGDISILYNSISGIVDDSSVGIENDLGDGGLQIAFNTDYITENLGVYISYPQPQIDPKITSSVITSGDSLIIPFTYNALDNIGGIYHHELAIVSNDTLSRISIIDIYAEVVAPTLISAYRDTVVFDTTFINRVAIENMWFYNDSIGILSIEDVISSNDNFSILFPEYEALSGDDTTGYYVDLLFNANTRRLSGEVYGLEGEFISAKLYGKRNDQIELVSDIEVSKVAEDKFIINELVVLEEEDVWNLADNALFINFYTSENTFGSGEVVLLSKRHIAAPESYTQPFQSLYRPRDPVNDSTTFSVVSNAINSEDVKIHGFGSGIRSDASIEVSISAIDAILNVSDSTQQQFTISNIGTDTLYVGLSVGGYDFKSNKNANRAFTSDKTSESKFSEFRVPAFAGNTEHNISEPDYTILTTQTLSEYYGVLHKNGADKVLARIDFNEITSLVEIENDLFFSASEFLPGSDGQLLNLSLNGELFIIDIATSEVESAGQMPQNSVWTGLTASEDTNILYACNLDNLYTLNLITFETELIGNFNSGSGFMLGIAMNNVGELFGYGYDDNFYKINKQDGNATRIGYVGFDVGAYGQDLAYDFKNDQFIMSAINNAATYRTEIRRVNTSNGNTELLNIIEKENTNYQLGSIAFKNDSDSRMVKLDSSRYSIAPNQSANVSVNIYADDRNNGLHTSNIVLRSNDYSNPKIDIPLTLEVTGNNAIVGEYTKKINYGLHTVEDSVIDTAVIENTGKEVLTLILESISNPFSSSFSVGDTLKIDINDQVSFPITFYPKTVGVFDSEMTWSTNDPNLQELSIQLAAASERSSKELSLEFDAYETSLPRFSDEVVQFAVHSIGQDSVQFLLKSIIQTEWLDMDSVNMILVPDSTFSTSIVINTHDLEIGSYESSLLLTSDDPFYDSLIIPISLEVYNREIEFSGEISNEPMAIGEDNLRIALNHLFIDADSDSLIFDATSTNGSIDILFETDTLILSASLFGLDTINISAMDQHGDTLSMALELMANTRPSASSIDKQFSRMDQSIVVLFGLNEYFSDADENMLTYQIEQNETIADLIIDGDDNLIMKPEIIGTTIVDITAFDGFHYHTESFELTVGKPLGLQDEIEASFRLYPIPASNVITLSFDVEDRGNYEFRVIDLSGRTMDSQVIENVSGTVEKDIEISELQSGYYLLQLLAGDELILTKDFIKK